MDDSVSVMSNFERMVVLMKLIVAALLFFLFFLVIVHQVTRHVREDNTG